MPALHPDVSDVLYSIRELGFVSVQDGRVSAVPPLGPTAIPSRWAPTLKYILDYANQHRSWSGEFFVCVHDGWREYSRPVDAIARQYIPWEQVERGKFLGEGACGEPRFRHRHEDATIYPELPRQILSYNRHIGDRNTLLIPDVEFIATEFAGFLAEVKEYDIPWAHKSSKAIWRGSRFPVAPRGECDQPAVLHLRASAVELSAKPEFRAVLDASFETTPIAQMLKCRYQLDLDGYTSAWSALLWKLSSNSLVWKPKTHWEQWYYDRLLPGRHYVPLTGLTEVNAAFEKCENDQDDCRLMVAQANQLIKTLTYEYAVSEYTIR